MSKLSNGPHENASEEETQDFLREIVMLKHVGYHKHVIRLVACCTKQTPLIALLEHAPRGDLLTLLRAARGKRRDSDVKVQRQLSAGEWECESKLTYAHCSARARTSGRSAQVCSESRKALRDSDVKVERQLSAGESEYTNLSDSDPPVDQKACSFGEQRQRHYVAEPALQLDSCTMREYALQVALGMQHLEERGITHRDLAARNILVDGAGTLKVADFGLSRSGVYVHTRARPVPLRWLAPEAILHSQYCSASDVWAFAVLLWEIATLGAFGRGSTIPRELSRPSRYGPAKSERKPALYTRRGGSCVGHNTTTRADELIWGALCNQCGFPYAELSNHQVPPFLAAGSRLPKPARASNRLYQLMVLCWAELPTDRPTFAQIVDKLNDQKQLYIDLECILPPSYDEALSDYDFADEEVQR
ncbi:hypothetical protein MSG28_010101 [Choristoneura fumiferana]|uniref:Uncharacterized protein n=1 Tax=Choristoneura fumiferana TaxID=7141 RepID=A0ACC0KJC9_CHOFU|nr:hypothetical protein MSG28_010101 [Choristoneura fumiferana]